MERLRRDSIIKEPLEMAKFENELYSIVKNSSFYFFKNDLMSDIKDEFLEIESIIDHQMMSDIKNEFLDIENIIDHQMWATATQFKNGGQ
jgi:endonuclease III-like uncharacterized protein